MKIIGKPFNYETFKVYNPFKVKKNETYFQQKKKINMFSICFMNSKFNKYKTI